MAAADKFHKKAFFSFMTLFIWLILIVTGIVLYFSPPGRVAHWIEWRFMGLTKEGWQAVHTIFSFTFVIVAALHLYLNWVIFWSYLRSLLKKGIKMRRELILSGLIIMTLFVLIISELPPFQTVMDLGETLSNSWSNEQSEPPVPHAELLTLPEYADKAGQDLSKLLHNLRLADLQGVDTILTITEIAKLNQVSPKELLEKVDDNSEKPEQVLMGYGRMNIQDICIALNIDEANAHNQLQKYHIRYEKSDLLKYIAEQNGLKPIDIVNIIKGEEKSEPEDVS
jgi:hypothetical protein